MKFKNGFVEMALEDNKIAQIGRASLNEIEIGLRDADYDIYTAKSVSFPGRVGGPNKIEAGVLLDPNKIILFGGKGIANLDVVMWPHKVAFDAVALGKLTQELERARAQTAESAKARAETIYRSAIEIYERCRAVLLSLKGINSAALSSKNPPDSELIKEVASLGEAVKDLRVAVFQAAYDLLNGEGRILGELEGMPAPNEQEAREALKLAITAIRVAYWFRKNVEWGNLVSGYSDLIPFDTTDLEIFFLAGLLENSGMWGGQDLAGHEARSAQVVRLLRTHGCDLPEGLEDLILHHSYIWASRFVYRSECIVQSESTEEIITHSFHQRDVLGQERRILDELDPHTSAKARPAESGVDAQTFVERLANKFMASALILSLTESFINEVVIGRPELLALDRLIAVLEMPSDYNLVFHRQKQLPMMAYALAAIANAFNILPVGAWVEFRNSSEKKSVKNNKEYGLAGGLALIIQAKNEDPYSPYLCLIAHPADDAWLKAESRRLIALGQTLEGKIYRGERRLTVAVVRWDIFSKFLADAVNKIPAYREELRNKRRPV
ncbi:MAG: hypothetical protein Q8Q95_00420 [bacterium]|nr:hypothetical protein [bacterium]